MALSFWLVPALELCSVTTATHFTPGYLGWLAGWLAGATPHPTCKQIMTLFYWYLSAVLSCNAMYCTVNYGTADGGAGSKWLV